jgi:hypothetical protein
VAQCRQKRLPEALFPRETELAKSMPDLLPEELSRRFGISKMNGGYGVRFEHFVASTPQLVSKLYILTGNQPFVEAPNLFEYFALNYKIPGVEPTDVAIISAM